MITGSIIGVLAVLVGFVLGRIWPTRQRPQRRDVARCTCGHPWREHGASGSCYHNAIKLFGACNCMRYDGPQADSVIDKELERLIRETPK